MLYATAETVPDTTKYFTTGQRYPVIDDCGEWFEIMDNTGARRVCSWKRCSHLHGAEWKRETILGKL